MTKMGFRCFLVFVFITMIQSTFALECHNVFSIEKTTCDECIRCGGVWCKDPKEMKQCKNPNTGLDDEWCPYEKEIAHVEPNSRDGAMFSPAYEDSVAEINSGKVTDLKILKYVPVKSSLTATYAIINTTQPSGKSSVEVHVETNKAESTYIVRVTTTVKAGFCSPTSRKFEYVFIEVGVSGVAEKAVLKYHVPCACACSEETDPWDQQVCHGHGNLTCGSCQCHDDRRGKFCEKRHCPDRGDVSSSCLESSQNTDQKPCSGNGFCDECNKCQCYNDIQTPGSQYFDADNNCLDLCTTISSSELLVDCLTDNEEGPCKLSPDDILQKFNASLLEERDYSNRTIWIKCSISEYRLEYWAMKSTHFYMMRKDSGDSGALVNTAGRQVTIPVIIGIVAAIAAAVAAAVGYVMWKGQGALPTAGSNYANIEPEDSVGVNPLYKPPTSSFKNPMYAAKS